MSATTPERCTMLEARLWDGDQRIRQAEASGDDVTAWETFWLQLLREYEAACRELDPAHAISPAELPAGPMEQGGLL